MTAVPVPQTRFHRCLHTLWSVDRWVCKSGCHYNQTVDLPAPGLKPGRAA